MLLALVFGWSTVAAGTALMALSAYLISAAALHPALGELSSIIVGVRFFGLARAICRYGERYVSHDATFRLLERIRVCCYQWVEAQPWTRFLARERGEWLDAIIEDVEVLKEFYLRSLLPFAVALLAVATGCGLLLLIDGRLALLLLASSVVAGVLLPWQTKCQQAALAEELGVRRKRLRETILETTLGMESLWAAGRLGNRLTRLDEASAALIAAQEKSAALIARGEACGQLVLQSSVLALLCLTILLIEGGTLDGVYLAPLVLGVQSALEAVLALPAAIYYLAESRDSWTRLRKMRPREISVDAKRGASALEQAKALTVRSLTYRHSEEQAGIEDISFSLMPGQRIAIVGASGAGKSTLLQVLLGFLPKQGGEIFLDGQSVEALPLGAVSVVPQSNHLFQASLEENVRLAAPQASSEQFDAACAAAGLDEVVAALPDGPATLLGAQGVGLSGGERQRVALARGFLKRAPILIWDEATVGLDALREETLLAALAQQQNEVAVLLVTHRLTVGLEQADEILVLDAGRIVERGSFAKLLASRGLFWLMWKQQRELLDENLLR